MISILIQDAITVQLLTNRVNNDNNMQLDLGSACDGYERYLQYRYWLNFQLGSDLLGSLIYRLGA